MKEKFGLLDTYELIDKIKYSSESVDLLPEFLKRFDFDDIFKTKVGSIVYEVNEKENIKIELFNIENVKKRRCRITIFEHGNLTVEIVETV